MTLSTRRCHRTAAVGVVLPIHNEEQYIATALDGVARAMAGLPHTVRRALVLVLDACHDSSEALARDWADRLRKGGSPILPLIIETSSANVGAARRLGCETLLHEWDGLDADSIWVATTDADSQVPPNWLSTQVDAHERGVDLWSGRVDVDDWSDHHWQTAARWKSQYEDELHPIHGASLGFNGSHYVAAGGFPPVQTGEDRALYAAMASKGALIHHDTTTMVITSARRVGRAPYGFSAALVSVENALGSWMIDPHLPARTSPSLRRPDLAAS
jgi:hypothetical protein